MSRTVGAAIGAVLFILFTSMLATSLMRPASPEAGTQTNVTRR